ncbi:MAG: metal-dependent hydrolase [Syntrophaceae bacterium]|nr:metal-dependent hydrolase [Syntrophaceae bacterium]
MGRKGLGVFVVSFFFVSFFFSSSLPAAEIGQGVKITYLGHAAFKLVSAQGVVIYIDPYLKNNPQTPPEHKEVDKADLILITHGHGDHLGDAVAIAQKTNASAVAMAELATYLTQKGLKNVVRMNKGGSYTAKGIRVTLVNAQHSSSVTEEGRVIYTGEPGGFIIRFENGFTVYHAGDTAVMADMKIFGDIYKPNLALLPIGSHFTMDPVEAAYACQLLRPQFAIPMHYKTFPVLTGTPEAFLQAMKDQPGVKVLVINPGQTIE